MTLANGGDNIGVYVPVFAVAGASGMTAYNGMCRSRAMTSQSEGTALDQNEDTDADEDDGHQEVSPA